MTAQPTLSVLLTMHTEPDRFASLVETLLDFELPDCELIIISDRHEAVDEGLWQLPDALSSRKNVFVERLPSPVGRATALNRGLALAQGSFIWAPQQASRLNKMLMREVLRKVSAEPEAFWVLDQSLPSDPAEWLNQLHRGHLPADEQLLINRSAIPPQQLLFREGLGRYTLTELIYRVHKRRSWQKTDSFFVIDRQARHRPPATVRQEFLFSMLRMTIETEDRQPLLDALSTLDFTTPGKEEGESIVQQARALAEEDARRALEMINNHLASQPHHTEALKLKVALLEQLRRHVEAAELKYELNRKRKNESAKDPASLTKRDHQVQPNLFSDGSNKISEPSNEISEPSRADEADSGLSELDEPFSLIKTNSDEPSGQEETDYGNSTAPDSDETTRPHYELSIIIPTAGQGRHLLESCLIRLEELCDPHTTELIIIDNASIDDTFDYLNQLSEVNFFNIRVITNSRNAGFARSVNQGMEVAQGTYHLVMHNDLLPDPGAIQEMVYIMENNPHIGVTGPLIDNGDVESQLAGNIGASEESYIKTDLLDSCCMLFRASAGTRFNEVYGLAFYESADVCRELAGRGYNIAIATDATATHLHRQTTGPMGLHLDPWLRLENADIYNARWDLGPDLRFPAKGDIFDRIRSIPLPANIFNPPGYWLDQMEALFTSEVRTVIQGTHFEDEDLFKLIRVLLVADRRDFLRQMEERIIDSDLPEELLRDLVRYYFRHNIYSRCKLYLEKPQATGLLFDLYRLRIKIDEKEIAGSVELLNKLMEACPCHPELYWIAAEMHHIAGNEEEAESFSMLAEQLYPERGRDIDAFEIKY